MVAVIVALLAARVHAVAQVTADLRFKDLGSPDLSWAPPTPQLTFISEAALLATGL